MVFGVLAAVVLGLVAYFAILAVMHQRQAKRQFALDKVRYAQTEKDMAAAYAAVVKAVGQPYEMNSGKGCSYGNLKYARGPLGCGIAYEFTYQVADAENGIKLAHSIQATIKSFKITQYPTSQDSAPTVDLATGNNSLSYSYDSLPGMGCELSYLLNSSNEYNRYIQLSTLPLKRDITENYAAYFTFSCTGGAVKALYPISKSPG